MSNASGQLVTVFGGSGFVGRHVVRALARRGYRIRVAVRRPDLAYFLQPLGGVGQIHAVQANLRNAQSVEHAMAGSHAVINLVGILSESGKQRFSTIQSEGAATVARAARDLGVEHFVHLSAIGADPTSASAYARSKAEGERAVRAALKDAVILRPSIIFGPEDGFFNRFAELASVLPVLHFFNRFLSVMWPKLSLVPSMAHSNPARLTNWGAPKPIVLKISCASS